MHDRVERNGVFRVAVEVGLDVALVLVDVAALPVPVGPLGQQRRQRAGQRAGTRAGARRASGRAEQVQPQRPGGRARGDLDLVAEVELRARGRRSRATPPSRARRAPTAPARSRPAGCRPGRACRPGSRGRCSGGRRRARPSARPGRRAAPWRAPSPVRRCSACPATRGRAGAPAARRRGARIARSSSTTWSGPALRHREPRAPASREVERVAELPRPRSRPRSTARSGRGPRRRARAARSGRSSAARRAGRSRGAARLDARP